MSPRAATRLTLALGALALLSASCAVQPSRAEETEFFPIAPLAAPATTTSTPPTTTTPPTTAPPTPQPTAPPEPVRQTLVVHGTGDVNLDPGFVRTFPSEGYDYAWSGLDGLFLHDGLSVVNLECSAGPGTRAWDKTWIFACDPDSYPAAAAAGVDIVNQANNHGADFGIAAMLDGSNLLGEAGLIPVGAGENAVAAYAPAVVDVDGWTIAVFGATAVGPENGSWAAGEDRAGVAAATNLEAMTAAIAEADAIADLVLITVHWGEEGDRAPRRWVRNLAEAYIDAGADGIFGHHTHRLGPLEWYRGRPIAWTLGNFVWQAFPAAATTTAIAEFVYEPDGRIGACLVPVVIERTGHPVVQDTTGPCAPPGL